MRLFIVLICLLLNACGGTFFRVPQEEYRQRVQTLGVVPILVDEGSDIGHPRWREVIELLHRHNVGKSERLVEMLRRKKGYFDVRLVGQEADGLPARLLSGSEPVSEKGRLYRSYRFDPRVAAELARREVVDALLVMVMHGVERREKKWERGAVPTTYLETDYRGIAVSAAVVTPGGEILWEFPGMPGSVFLPLQYPDFDEAHYNRTTAVKVHDITIAGLDRTLSEADYALLSRTDFPRLYQELFDAIAAGLDPGLAEKKAAPSAEKGASRQGP